MSILGNKSVVLVIEGMIGVGKSTAVETLLRDAKSVSHFEEVIVLPEPIKKEVLDDYIRDMKDGNRKMRAWSFQMTTAVKRLHDYDKARRLARAKPNRLVVIDRGLFGNEAFARMQCKRGHFDEVDLHLYEVEIGVHDGSLERLRDDPIFQTVYLRATPETAWRRTLARGDKEEVGGYDLQYMQDLFDAHEEVLKGQNVVTLNWENDEAVENGKIEHKLLARILNTLVVQ